ncbi:MAG: helix-turn-helix domain-containing protein [Acidimicrobiales bacterium]
MPEEDGPPKYAAKVGGRLRALRQQKKMSLLAVESLSAGRFKASVLGAYERGERAISVERLSLLAEIYSVPVAQLLPRDEVVDLRPGAGLVSAGGHQAGPPARGKLRIDLVALQSSELPGKELVERYLGRIQLERQDFNGRVLTVRSDDVRALSCLLDLPTDETPGRLSQFGLRAALA